MVHDVWCNCIEYAAKEVGLDLTLEQIQHIAGSVEVEVENYDQSSYSPGPSAYAEIMERDHKRAMSIAKDQADVEIQRLREEVRNLRSENERLSDRLYRLQREGRP